MNGLKMITKDEEHSFQYALKKDAILMARLETQQTHRMHQVVKTITYRNLEPAFVGLSRWQRRDIMSEQVRVTERLWRDMIKNIREYRQKIWDTRKLAARHNCQRNTWAETLAALDEKLTICDGQTMTACHGCEKGVQPKHLREVSGRKLCIDCVIQENTDLRDTIDRLRCDLQFHKGEALRAEVERLKAKPNA